MCDDKNERTTKANAAAAAARPKIYAASSLIGEFAAIVVRQRGARAAPRAHIMQEDPTLLTRGETQTLRCSQYSMET